MFNTNLPILSPPLRKQDKIQASTTLALAIDGAPPGKHADKNMMLVGDVGVELANHARPDPSQQMGNNEMNTVGRNNEL